MIKKLEKIFVNDEDTDNRYHALQVIGKLGLLVPNKVLQYLITQLYDPDPKIQAYSIMALTQIANKHVGEVKEILPFLTEAFEKMPKRTESGFVYDILGQSIKKISEHLYEKNIADFMTTEQISCPYCKEFYPASSEVCTNCGKAVAKCSICGQKLQHDVDMKACPFCKTVFHKDHLLAWIKMNRNCPNCLRSLFEEDLQ